MNPFILWLLGPTSAGKTTLAKHFTGEWRKRNQSIIHFDGDEIRNLFGNDFGFRPEDRLKVVSTLIHLAKKSSEAGMSAVISALTASGEARELVSAN
jgi:adenylylsulfate kinase